MDPRAFPQPKQQNLIIYTLVNSLMIILELLGGAAGYTFFGNIFSGLTVGLSLVCVLIVVGTPNVDFAATHRIGWWNVFPIVIGLIAVGFGWYFSCFLWWGMSVSMMVKKAMGDADIAKLALDNDIEQTPAEPVNETYYGRRVERGE